MTWWAPAAAVLAIAVWTVGSYYLGITAGRTEMREKLATARAAQLRAQDSEIEMLLAVEEVLTNQLKTVCTQPANSTKK